MEFDEFRHYFTRLSICKYVDCNQLFSKKVKMNENGYHLVKMEVDTPGEHTVSVCQFDVRCAPLDTFYEYVNCKVVVLRAVRGKLENGVVYMNSIKTYM